MNLSQCTKAVDPGLQPLCPQDVYLNDDPKKVYEKLLCCENCAPKINRKRNLLLLYLGVSGTCVVVIILLLIILVLASKYRTARKYVREIQEGDFLNAAAITFLNRFNSSLNHDLNWWCSCFRFCEESISTNLYTYRELKKATRNFHKDNKLGEGGFGEVYLVTSSAIYAIIHQLTSI